MTVCDTRFPKVSTVGLDGILVTFGAKMDAKTNAAARAFRTAVDRLGWSDIEESASTLVSAFFRIDLVAHDPEATIARFEDLLRREDWQEEGHTGAHTRWTIPVAFGGARAPALKEAAALAGVTEAQARRDLTDTDLRVLTLGFAPGTPYCGYLPDHWDIPRQTDLSMQVPVGAVIVAVRQMILFSKTSPTGWRHVGQTAFRGFQPQSDTPILLRAGDALRFAEVSEDTLATLEASGDPLGGAKREHVS